MQLFSLIRNCLAAAALAFVLTSAALVPLAHATMMEQDQLSQEMEQLRQRELADQQAKEAQNRASSQAEQSREFASGIPASFFESRSAR